MFPPNALRMNGIYGGNGSNNQPSAEFGPPNFNGGIDIGSILPGILQYLHQNKQDDRNYEQQMHPKINGMDPNDYYKIQESKRQFDNVSGNERANLAQKQTENLTKIKPSTYNGMDAKDFFDLQEKKREFDTVGAKETANLAEKKQTGDEKNTIDKAKLDEKTTTDKSKIDIAGQRASVYAFKAQHPGMKIIIPKGGNITAIDPITGRSMDLGIDSGTLSDNDRIDLMNDNKLSQIEKQGENQQEVIKAKGEQTSKIPVKPESGTSARIRSGMTAREFTNKNPDLAKYVTFDNSGNPIVTPPGSFLGAATGPTAEQFKKINDALYTTKQSTEQPVKKQEAQAPTAPKGWKYVPKPGGGWTAVEDKGGEE